MQQATYLLTKVVRLVVYFYLVVDAKNGISQYFNAMFDKKRASYYLLLELHI